MKLHKKIPLIIAVVACCIFTTVNLQARKIKYAAKEVKKPIKQELVKTEYSNEMFDITGYDKAANSDKESFFVTNNTDQTISYVDINIIYRLEDGRMLHNRNEKIELMLLPGQTKIVYLKTWDKQHNFRYHLSAEVSKRKQTTPYWVTVTPLFIYH